MTKNVQNINYKSWIIDLKSKIQQSQIKAALSVNSELILLYWELGKEIAEKQETAKWGSGLINQLSVDLKREFPDIGGLSTRNLQYAVKFFKFYSKSNTQQLVAQLENTEKDYSQQVVANLENTDFKNVISIPWGHNILIIEKVKSLVEAKFYINKTIENNWSRAILLNQIDSNLFERQGKSISNFESLTIVTT